MLLTLVLALVRTFSTTEVLVVLSVEGEVPVAVMPSLEL